MTHYTPKSTDALSAAGVAVQPSTTATSMAGSLANVLVHPLDTSATLSDPSDTGVWNSATASIPSSGIPISTSTATGSLLGSAAEGLAVQPVDYDNIFKPKDIQPADLIPKVDPELYPGITADLNQSFMTNELQASLPMSNRRKYIEDIRQIFPNPITVTTPWCNPTTFPDITRRSLCDL